MIGFILAVAVAAAPTVQGPTPATIDSGMTRAQVVAKLGEPMSTRTYDGHTYLLYKNGCERSCGMSDLVVLDSDKVVDAIFRSSARRYSGTSSSPRMISLADARGRADKTENVAKAERAAAPVKVEAVVMPKADKPVKADKAAAPAKVASIAAPKAANVAAPKVQTVQKVEQVKIQPVRVEAVKVEKVENGDAAPSKSAAPKPPAQAAPSAQAAPKLPQVFRPAPTPKKDTTKKSEPVKKPTS